MSSGNPNSGQGQLADINNLSFIQAERSVPLEKQIGKVTLLFW
jgi:hypothetical protein